MTVSLTDKVKLELVSVDIPRQSAKSAEASTLLRLTGELQPTPEGLNLDINVEDEVVGQRLARLLDEVLGIDLWGQSPAAGAGNKKPRLQMSIPDAKEVARRLGLVTRSGHAVIGLPPQVIAGSIADVEAVWRGAFLAYGFLNEPGRSSSLEVVCPCQEIALALVGCARRLGIVAKTKETRGADRVVVRDGEAIGALLTRMGAHVTRLEWDQKRLRAQAQESTNARLENFDDANQRRSARAAENAAQRVARAMDILGDSVPEHLADAGFLRVKYRDASLEELGRHADPPMTKDAVAGRIRRLLTMADKRAAELGIPDTNQVADAPPNPGASALD